MEEIPVVTCFLRNRAEILLLKRSEAVGTDANLWGGVAGPVEDDPAETAVSEIRDATGLTGVEFVRAGDPFPVEDDTGEPRWIVHPCLFDSESREVTLHDQSSEFDWVQPPEIFHRSTVPALWESYRRVRPTVETVGTDRTHGSAYLSLRALEVLRDRGAEISAGYTDGEWEPLAGTARHLLDARPAMAAVRNRVNGVMSAAVDSRTPAAVTAAAIDGITSALEAHRQAVRAAAECLSGSVFTLSRSGTVSATLAAASVEALFVAESFPGREGITVAESFAQSLPTTVVADAAVGHVFATRDPDVVIVGADTVLPDGRVVNKVGTCGATLAARQCDIPVYAVATGDKVSPEATIELDPRDRTDVYDGEASISVVAPTFDVTPAEAVSVITEDGPVDTDDLSDLASRYRRLATWEA